MGSRIYTGVTTIDPELMGTSVVHHLGARKSAREYVVQEESSPLRTRDHTIVDEVALSPAVHPDPAYTEEVPRGTQGRGKSPTGVKKDRAGKLLDPDESGPVLMSPELILRSCPDCAQVFTPHTEVDRYYPSPRGTRTTRGGSPPAPQPRAHLWDLRDRNSTMGTSVPETPPETIALGPTEILMPRRNITYLASPQRDEASRDSRFDPYEGASSNFMSQLAASDLMAVYHPVAPVGDARHGERRARR